MRKNTILIADHYAIARRGLREVLQQEHSWEVIGEAVDGVESALIRLGSERMPVEVIRRYLDE